MDRVVNVRMYSVDTNEDGGLAFSAALQHIAELDLDDREYEIEPDLIIRLEQLTRRQQVLCGEFVRRQSTNLPAKALKGRPVESLGVNSIGHSTAFAFDMGLSVIALQLSRNGITPTRIADYAQELAGGSGFDMLPAPNQQIWEKLKRGGVRGLSFRVSSPNELRAIDDETRSIRRSMVAMKDSLQPSRIEITMAMMRGDPDISRKKTLDLFGWLRRERDEERGGVSKLIARISSDEGEAAEVLNLIGGHMGDKEWLNLPDDDPQGSYRLRSEYIQRVLRQHHRALEEMYGN